MDIQLENVVCDQGYPGHNYVENPHVHVVRYIPRNAKRSYQRLIRRRSSIESRIGHMKSDHRLDRNYITSQKGERINALLAAVGYNFRKLLREVFFAIIHRLVGWLNRVATAAGVIQ